MEHLRKASSQQGVLLIFNLDRFIVSTIKKRNNFLDELLKATPRLILAVIIAVVISKPLELKIFEKEINQVLLTEKNQMTLDNQDQIALQCHSPLFVRIVTVCPIWFNDRVFILKSGCKLKPLD